MFIEHNIINIKYIIIRNANVKTFIANIFIGYMHMQFSYYNLGNPLYYIIKFKIKW
jgi:hypothetical protein